jgi:hypothetical protein
MRKLFWLIPILAAANAGGALAASCEKASPRTTTGVLELYTSEGCSSCPPADKWLSGVSNQYAPEGVVALGFHVDYWDYIGWKDEFGRAAYSKRQHDVAAANKSRIVYTPQVVLNGRDYRNWSNGAVGRDLAKLKDTPARADIRVTLDAAASGLAARVEASVPNPADRGGAVLYLALTQNNLVTPVKAGENSGVTLKHDHVVREWIGPIALNGEGKAVLNQTLVLPKGAKLGDLGVAALVQKPATGDVLQALALPACKG